MGKAVVPSSIVFEVLEKDNYEDWSETIRAYLEFKDLWDVVESNEQPPDRDADEAIKILEFKAWNKKNSEALHAIKISCGRNFLSKIRGIREANKAWRTLQAYFNPPLPRRMEYTINPEQGDEENVDDEYKEAYMSLVDALSRRDISDTIELCKKNPGLLKERLPNYTPLFHQLIMLCTYPCEDKDKLMEILMLNIEVVEMLKLDHFPKEALEMTDSLGRTPLAVAIDSLSRSFGYSRLIDELYSITPSSVWTLEDGKYGATLITTCIEVIDKFGFAQKRILAFASKCLKEHPRLTFAKDVNGISPLYAAAYSPSIFTSRHNRKFAKFVSSFLRRPLYSMDFEISGIELLIAMRNAIKDLKITSGLLRDAFFEAIKCGNFNFIVMLISADKKNLEEVDDMSKNMYMCAIEYREPKIFSLIYWDKKDSTEAIQSTNVWQDKWKNNLLHMVSTWTPPIILDGLSKPAELVARDAIWFTEVFTLASPYLERKSNVDGKTPLELFLESHKDLFIEARKWIKESAASWAIVGPLVMTIMFAAAFQIPGGYNQEKGLPIFLNKKLFKLYMVLVSISFFSATVSVFKSLEILSSTHREKDFLDSLRTSNVMTGTLFLTLATMLIAFCSGLTLILHGELAIFLPIVVIATFLVGYIVYKKFHVFVETFSIYKWTRNSPFEKNIRPEVERIFEMLNRPLTEEVAI